MGIGLPAKPSSFYWKPLADPTQDYGNSQWGLSMLEQSPQTEFYRRGQELGIPDDQSGFGRWFKAQFPQFQQGYNAYTVSNPLTANVVDYANSLGNFGDWYRQYVDQAPQIRGLDPSNRGGGPARWVMR